MKAPLFIAVAMLLTVQAQVMLPHRRAIGGQNPAWTPAQLPGLRYWWVASDLTVGANVTNWVDRVQSVAFTNTTSSGGSAAAPTNSSSGVHFTGAECLPLASGSVPWVLNPAGTGTVWVVVMPLGSNASRPGGIIANWNGSEIYGFGTEPGNVLQWRFNGFDQSFGVFGCTVLDCAWITTNLTNHVFYKDGSSIGTNNVTITGDFGRIGRYFFGADDFYNGYIQEIVFSSNALSAAEMTLLHSYSNSRYAVPNPAPSEPLILWYKFTEGSGTTIADSSGNGNGGTLSGATWVTGKSGSGYALQFDGINDYAKTTAAINMGTNIITMCAWIYWNAFANDDKFIWELSTNYANVDNAFVFDPDESSNSEAGLAIQSGVSSTKYRTEGFARWSAATWTHLAVVYDNSTSTGDIKVYVNGSLSSTTIRTNTKDQSGNFATETLWLFSRAGASLFGAGRMDDLRIYGGELTSQEVCEIYNEVAQ